MSIARDAKAYADVAAEQGRRAVGHTVEQTKNLTNQSRELANQAYTQLRSRGDALASSARTGSLPGIDPARLEDIRARADRAAAQAAAAAGQARAAGETLIGTISGTVEHQVEQLRRDPRWANVARVVDGAEAAAGAIHDHLVAPILRTIGI